MKSNNEIDIVLPLTFATIVIGVIATHLRSEYVPYSCVIFSLGIVLAVIAHSVNGLFFESIRDWARVDPDLILFALLPPLLFGETMCIPWAQIRRHIAGCSLLAGPGVLITSVLMTVLTLFILEAIHPHVWPWSLCAVFASLLSATDPVAVVALLEEVNAARSLRLMIVGESLLNDGTAIVLFVVCIQLWTGSSDSSSSSLSGAEIVEYFCAAMGGSIAIGIGIGLLGTALIRGVLHWESKTSQFTQLLESSSQELANEQTLSLVMITLVCAYVSFFVAQAIFDWSGALSCVICAATVSAWSPLLTTSPNLHRHSAILHAVWDAVEWLLNTLVFFVAGLVVGEHVLFSVHAMDWAAMVLLAVALLVARALSIIFLFPLLQLATKSTTSSHIASVLRQDSEDSILSNNANNKEKVETKGVTLNECIFLSWAGLRGALSLLLALRVYNEKANDDERAASQLVFYVSGIVAISLVAYAPASRWLLSYLGLSPSHSSLSAKSMDHSAQGGRPGSEFHESVQFAMQSIPRMLRKEFHISRERSRSVCDRFRWTQHVSDNALSVGTITESNGLDQSDHDLYAPLNDSDELDTRPSLRRDSSDSAENVALGTRNSNSSDRWDATVRTHRQRLRLLQQRWQNSLRNGRLLHEQHGHAAAQLLFDVLEDALEMIDDSHDALLVEDLGFVRHKGQLVTIEWLLFERILSQILQFRMGQKWTQDHNKVETGNETEKNEQTSQVSCQCTRWQRWINSWHRRQPRRTCLRVLWEVVDAYQWLRYRESSTAHLHSAEDIHWNAFQEKSVLAEGNVIAKARLWMESIDRMSPHPGLAEFVHAEQMLGYLFHCQAQILVQMHGDGVLPHDVCMRWLQTLEKQLQQVLLAHAADKKAETTSLGSILSAAEKSISTLV